ncbi:MAG: tetratricopeptide repeat protein [Thermoanaerobaculia bacterium]
MTWRRAGALFALLTLLGTAAAFAQDATKLEAEARRAFDAGRFKEAGDKFGQAAAAAASPEQKGDLHLQSAWSYYIGGNSRGARDALKLAFAERPRLEVISDFYSPDFARLAETVRAEVGGPAAPPNTSAAKAAARDWLARGDPDAALRSLRGLDASPDPQVHRLMAEAYEKIGRPTEADAARQRASEAEKALISSAPIGPGGIPSPGAPAVIDAGALLETAQSALDAGDARVAESLARRAAEAEPRNAEAQRIAGEAALALDQLEDAEKAFAAAIAVDSGNRRAEFGLARVSEKQKKWSTAASHYRRALELDPGNLAAARGLGRSMEALGDSTGARLAYGRAVEIDPTSAPAHNDFGAFLYRAGETDRAVAELIEAVRLDPEQPVYHENLGRAYRKKGMAREAERELADAARLSPGERGVWVLLGQLRAAGKKPEEAAAAYASAFSIDRSDEEAASGLGLALADAGKFAEAEASLLQAVEASPQSGALWNNLGIVRTRRGSYAEAVDAFRKALSLDPKLEAARANLERAEQLLALDRAAAAS